MMMSMMILDGAYMLMVIPLVLPLCLPHGLLCLVQVLGQEGSLGTAS